MRDEGQGIRKEFLPYLFDRFTQSDSASNRFHRGLGLGLSIVKRLVDLHGGTVSASSVGSGMGAMFSVTVPATPVGAAAAQAIASQGGESGSAMGEAVADLQGLRIVVVEDDHEAREVLVMILRERGATVIQASDYAEGLRRIGDARPDILISDIGMAGSDGYALIRELRRQERGSSRLPAIALTAFARARDRQLALEAGFDTHCAKPLDTAELVAAVQRLVAREAEER